MIEKLRAEEDTPYFQAIRADAISMASPNFLGAEDELPPDMHYPLEEPATDLKIALARPEVDELIKDALHRFGNAEKELLQLATDALTALLG